MVPRTQKWWAVRGAIVATLIAAAVGGLATIDYLHPRDRIVSGGWIWDCALVGGSWPVDAASEVKLRPGLSIGAIGAATAVAPGCRSFASSTAKDTMPARLRSSWVTALVVG